MTGLSIDDVLDVEYPEPPALGDDIEYLATAVYEDDGQALQFADSDGELQWRYRPDGAYLSAFAWRPGGHDCLVVTDDDRTLLVNPTKQSVRTLVVAPESGHT